MSVRFSSLLVPSPPGRADPRPVSSDSIMQMPGLPQLPGCAGLQKQSPFICLAAMWTWVQPLESVHHHEVWMYLWIWEKHIRPAASVYISGHMHHCKCLRGGSVLFLYSLDSKAISQTVHLKPKMVYKLDKEFSYLSLPKEKKKTHQ